MTIPNQTDDPVCPLCGSGVVWDFTCHTYFDGRVWMACITCDSAVIYMCDGDDVCKWSYTEGLNRDNPRYQENLAAKPDWDCSLTGGGILWPVLAEKMRMVGE